MSENQVGPVGSAPKGRPTPKRRDQQPRRGGPVPPPPTTRREAAKRMRAKQAAERASGRTAPGDPGRPGRPTLKRDQGEVRAMVRDVVDARRNFVIFVLPILMVWILASLTKNQGFVSFVSPLYYGALLAMVFDLFSISRTVKRRVRAEFPEDSGKGHALYGVLRAVQFRRFRLPAPQVEKSPLFRRRRGR